MARERAADPLADPRVRAKNWSFFTVLFTTSVQDRKPAIHPCRPPRNRIKADELPSIDHLESWQWSHASRRGFVNPHKLRRFMKSPLDYLTYLTLSAMFRSIKQEKPGKMSSDRCAAGFLSFHTRGNMRRRGEASVGTDAVHHCWDC